jgi:hypothetical protein
MKTLKESIDKISNGKKRKELLQFMNLNLINDFLEKIGLIMATLE